MDELLRPWDCKIFPKTNKTICFGGSDGILDKATKGIDHNFKQLHHGMDVIFAGKPMYEQKEQKTDLAQEAIYSQTSGSTKKSSTSDAKKSGLSTEGAKKTQGKASLYAKKKKKTASGGV